ncbi:MAG TPA: DinB family protein [Pyrinomonadaceae bacterium]|nr:DinB family protein [Pyrinomonadaceae bacterium]
MEDSQDVIEFLQETPAVFRKLAQGLADGDLRWKPSGDQFSFVENACHLRDIELEGYGARIRKLLTEDDPQLPDVDGGRLARERDYNSQEFGAALDDFTRARDENLRAIKNLSAEQLDRKGVLEGVGEITLGKLFLLMREHDESHRQELIELRAHMKDRVR